jgi:hypothetical protein
MGRVRGVESTHGGNGKGSGDVEVEMDTKELPAAKRQCEQDIAAAIAGIVKLFWAETSMLVADVYIRVRYIDVTTFSDGRARVLPGPVEASIRIEPPEER